MQDPYIDISIHPRGLRGEEVENDILGVIEEIDESVLIHLSCGMVISIKILIKLIASQGEVGHVETEWTASLETPYVLNKFEPRESSTKFRAELRNMTDCYNARREDIQGLPPTNHFDQMSMQIRFSPTGSLNETDVFYTIQMCSNRDIFCPCFYLNISYNPR